MFSTTPDSPSPAAARATRWALLAVSLLIAAGFWLLRPGNGVEVERFVLLGYPAGADADVRAFVAEIELGRAGYPLLVQLDEDGWPDRLFPYDGLVGIPAGQALRLPDPDRGVAWGLDGPPVARRYLVAATRDRDLDVDDVMREAQREARRAPTREEARSRVLEVLEDRVGPVRTARLASART